MNNIFVILFIAKKIILNQLYLVYLLCLYTNYKHKCIKAALMSEASHKVKLELVKRLNYI